VKKAKAAKLQKLARRAGVSLEEYLDRALQHHLSEADRVLKAVERGRAAVRAGKHRSIDEAEAELNRRRKARNR
jgi:hypothetical protein